MAEIMDKEMEKRIEYFKYARDLYSTMLKDKRFVIDGGNPSIGNIPLTELIDLDFVGDVKDEICLVHATNFFPENKEIICSYLGKREYELYYSHRLTVHTTINSPVRSHEYGSWLDSKFYILTPFKDVKSEVLGFGVADTFFKERINLSDDTLILVNEKNKEEMEKYDTSNMNIIYYKTPSKDIDTSTMNDDEKKQIERNIEDEIRTAIFKAMIAMGYKPQDNNSKEMRYNNKQNIMKLIDFGKKNEYGDSFHAGTIYSEIEDILESRDKYFYNKSDSQKVINTDEMKEISLTDFNNLFNAYKSENTEYMRFAEFTLKSGFVIEKYSIKVLNTIDAYKKIEPYFIKDSTHLNEEMVLNNEELHNQYENYQEMLKREEVHEEANSINVLLSKKLKDLSKEEWMMLNENDYFKNLIDSINSYCASFGIKITPGLNYFYIIDRNLTDDSNILENIGLPVDEFISNYKLNNDENKNILENIKMLRNELDLIKVKIEQYYLTHNEEQESNIKR